MTAIANFFSSFGELLGAIGQWFLDTLMDLWYAITMMVDFTLMIPRLFEWLPVSAVVIMVSMFAIVIVYKVLGREG